MTRAALEAERFRVFVEMTNSGSTTAEALAYLDLVLPFDKEVEHAAAAVPQS